MARSIRDFADLPGLLRVLSDLAHQAGDDATMESAREWAADLEKFISREKATGSSCWHSAHHAFTAKQRRQFNAWHRRMFEAIDDAVTWSDLDNPEKTERQRRHSAAVHLARTIIAEVPWMEE